MLTESQSLVRRPNSGTFVGPTAGAKPATTIRTVYLLMDSRASETGYRFDLMVQGIRKEMGDVNVQLSFVPLHDPGQYVTELISVANSAGQVVGFMALSCVREVYRVLSYSGFPAVAVGSLYPGDPQLPSIDIENHEAGRLLVNYLAKRGHSRIAMLLSPELRPGDNGRLAGVSEAMTALRLPPNALLLHSVPHESAALTALTENLLSSTERPSGFIIWGKNAADLVAASISKIGLRIPQDIEIAYFDLAMETQERTVHTCVRPQVPFETICSTAAKMLKQVSQREALQQERVVVPVHLVEAW